MDIYKAVIIDDVASNILILKHLVSKFCPNVKIVGEASTVIDAILVISDEKPNILFLDIRLNEDEIFEVFDKIDVTNTQVIFVTAHDEYALKAFKYNAIDYILKPINTGDLILAVNKAILKIQQKNYFDFKSISNIYKNVESPESKDYIAVASMDKIDLLKTSDIMYIGADSKYAVFHLSDGRQIMSNKNIIHYERLLDETYFFRIHNSYMVNMRYVAKIIKKDGSYCELTNGSLIPIAKRKQEDFNRFLKIRD